MRIKITPNLIIEIEEQIVIYEETLNKFKSFDTSTVAVETETLWSDLNNLLNQTLDKRRIYFNYMLTNKIKKLLNIK